MPDRALPTAVTPARVRQVLADHLPGAFEGLEWERDGDVYFVGFDGIRADGTVDRYLTKWTFVYYPDWPPHVTFVNPKTKQHDPRYWPVVNSSRLALNPNYGEAPEGLICNSMFFDWYFYGGHGDQPAVSWKKGVHTMTATVEELKIHLRQPFYQARADAGA
jgi:hypothetical protein